MTLHYRKLLVVSIAIPIVVVAVMVVGMPSLAESRDSAVLSTLHSQIRQMESLLYQIEAFNTQEELKEPLHLAHDVTQHQSDSLINLHEALASKSAGTTGAGWIAALSTLVGILGTLTSILFSWRHDMRAASAELNRLRPEAPGSRRRAA